MNRYPLKMRKLHDGQLLSKRAESPEEEAELVADGWSPKLPALPEAAQPQTDDTAAAIGSLAAAVAELAARVEKLEAKRGPGRPPKE
jgi:hypothetical protein